MANLTKWMVYRYAEHGDNGRIDRSVAKLKDPFWHPFAPITNDSYDAAQVFADIRDWQGDDTALGQFKKSATLVKNTGHNLHPTPTFIEPVLEEVKNEIRRSWNGSRG